jgi:hypothetical protein
MSLIRRTPGRLSDVRVTGPEDGPVLVFHHGTPGSASGYRVVEGPAHERGLRVVWMSRPGYGDSSRQRGRRVVDVVSDTAEVLDALGVDTCLVGGGSSVAHTPSPAPHVSTQPKPSWWSAAMRLLTQKVWTIWPGWEIPTSPYTVPHSMARKPCEGTLTPIESAC